MATRKLNKHMTINEQVAQATREVLDSGLMDHPTDQNMIREMMNKLDVSGTIFEEDPEAKRLIVDEALKVANDKEKLESLRDFLVTGEVKKQLGDLFDPTAYIDTLSQRIRELEEDRKKALMGIGEEAPEPVEEGSAPEKPALMEDFLKQKEHKDVKYEGLATGKFKDKELLAAPGGSSHLQQEKTETGPSKVSTELDYNVKSKVKEGPQAARRRRDNRNKKQATEQYEEELQKSVSELEMEHYKSIMAQNQEAIEKRKQEEAILRQKQQARNKKKKGLLAKMTPAKASLIMGGGIGGTVGGLLGSTILFN